MNNIELIPKAKSGIHIKKKNRGKFTEYCGGNVTSECILRGKRSSNPSIRKRATFADNARKWKHEEGSKIHKPFGHNLDNVIGNGWMIKSITKHDSGGNLFKNLVSFLTVYPKYTNVDLPDLKINIPAGRYLAATPVMTTLQHLSPTVQIGLDNLPNTTMHPELYILLLPRAAFHSADYNRLKSIGLEQLLKEEGINVRVTSGYREGAVTKQGRSSHHSSKDEYGRPGAYDIVPTSGDFNLLRQQMLSNPNVVAWMQLNGYGLLDETTPEMLLKTGGTGPHFHIGKDQIAVTQWNNLLNT